jgi:hypothetical protein
VDWLAALVSTPKRERGGRSGKILEIPGAAHKKASQDIEKKNSVMRIRIPTNREFRE